MVKQLDLSNVAQVAVVYNDDDANKLLDNGWKLLYVTSSTSVDDRYVSRGVFQEQSPCFVLSATEEVSNEFPKSKVLERRYH